MTIRNQSIFAIYIICLPRVLKKWHLFLYLELWDDHFFFQFEWSHGHWCPDLQFWQENPGNVLLLEPTVSYVFCIVFFSMVVQLSVLRSGPALGDTQWVCFFLWGAGVANSVQIEWSLNFVCPQQGCIFVQINISSVEMAR